ncbi:MAG: alpha/beta fold hydrolase [Gammaproteobacteria bacterium]|nr:alpha/beta fold hydrolase [Gammaproteobacteria bacterium]MBU1624366.1 alpha/beta fold hydrolase [Gammaproteobacteria bacterium]MBU1981094.1 alpha/beta fold hydrolase [Gammaproteobacteria bacterium]
MIRLHGALKPVRGRYNAGMNIPLQARHHSSGLNTGFAGEGMSFAEYIRKAEAMLRQAHAGKPDMEKIVAGNAPFESLPFGDFQKGIGKPYQRGVLLTHGLSDSPYHMRRLGEFFQRNGFRVMAVLLPGHGTQPGDLLDVHWADWAETVAYGVQCLAAEVDEVYLAGFSAGAALSLYHADKDERVRGLFMFSPALEIASRARRSYLHRLYSWLLPQHAWLNVMPDQDCYKYESFCLNAVTQMWRLTQSLSQGELNIPLFVAASADDATVSSAAALNFFHKVKHSLRKMLWYAAEDPKQADVEWVKSALPEKRILSGAHTAVVISPDDAHYGEAGEYANCLHYISQSDELYSACLSSHTPWLGEVTPENLKYGLLRRLMYNPHYAEMEVALRRFIERLP